MTELEYVKKVIGINDTSLDSDLSAYLDLAEETIISRLYELKGIPTNAAMPAKYSQTKVMAVIDMWNKRGAEGDTSQTVDGVKYSFQYSDLKDFVDKNVIPYAQVK